jgi:hypothetical protein
MEVQELKVLRQTWRALRFRLLTLPNARMSSPVGLETSSHQACLLVLCLVSGVSVGPVKSLGFPSFPLPLIFCRSSSTSPMDGIRLGPGSGWLSGGQLERSWSRNFVEAFSVALSRARRAGKRCVLNMPLSSVNRWSLCMLAGRESTGGT